MDTKDKKALTILKYMFFNFTLLLPNQKYIKKFTL